VSKTLGFHHSGVLRQLNQILVINWYLVGFEICIRLSLTGGLGWWFRLSMIVIIAPYDKG
jgi:hypothetical protein